MMSKIKSRNAARLKLFLVMPLASFLVLAFADPRTVSRVDNPTGLAPQEKSDQGHEELIKQEKIVQAQDELKMLKEKEMKLREKLDSAPTPEAKQEMKKQLEAVLQEQHELRAFLAKAGSPPDPNEPDLKAEYKMLKEKELDIREKLKATTDSAVKAELEATLAKVLDKEAKVKAMGTAVESTIDELKKQYSLLEQKAQDVRAVLEKTEDPAKKAELEDTLKKIAQKQEMIKFKAQAIKAKAEAGKAAQEEKKQ